MSRGFNKVILMGNLAKDPDIRFTASKQKIARITVAVGKQWKDKQTGETKNHTDFISVSAWGFTADICEKYLKKGRPVLLEGRLSVRDYDDEKTGKHVWITEVIAENITLLGGGQSDGQNTGREQPQRQQQTGYSADSDADEFQDEFPLDFSSCDGQQDAPGDVQIPF